MSALCRRSIFRSLHSTVGNLNRKIDYSRVPVLNEKDIEEKFIAGGGPGGSNVAKNNNCAALRHLPTDLFCGPSNIRTFSTSNICSNKSIDRSKVPVLNEEELDEQYVKGSGPGGQNVNKRVNCVVLRHTRYGIIVKCHESRLLETNRKLARDKLITKLDNLINKENSVENQMKMLEEKKGAASDRKKRKLRELKKQWKEREGLT